MHSIKPDLWLKWLTSALVIQGGEIRTKDVVESEGQNQLFSTQSLELVDSFDLVIEGPCSSSERLGLYDTRRFPMGMIGVEENGVRQELSWLHEIIAGAKPKKVLVYAECCGTYSVSFKELIRELFPDAQWTFAKVPDLYENSDRDRDRLAERLLLGGILKVVDAPVPTPK